MGTARRKVVLFIVIFLTASQTQITIAFPISFPNHPLSAHHQAQTIAYILVSDMQGALLQLSQTAMLPPLEAGTAW